MEGTHFTFFICIFLEVLSEERVLYIYFKCLNDVGSYVSRGSQTQAYYLLKLFSERRWKLFGCSF